MTEAWGDKFFGSLEQAAADQPDAAEKQFEDPTKEQIIPTCKLISKIMDLSDEMERLARAATDCRRSDLAHYFRDVSIFCITQARLMYLPLERADNWNHEISKPKVPENN